MNGKVTVLLAFASAGLISYLWYHFTCKLPAKYQFLISVGMVVLTWTWEANTSMVLQRGKGYCLSEPSWPPFIGPPVSVPQPIMLVMSLIALGSIGMAFRALVKFAERKEEVWR